MSELRDVERPLEAMVQVVADGPRATLEMREDMCVPQTVGEFIDDGEKLSEVFHANTKVDAVSELETGAMFAKVATNPMLHRTIASAYRPNRGLEVVALPSGDVVRASFGDVARRRRTVREFTGASVALDDVALVLELSCGITGEAALEDGIPLKLRAVPSGGGLYPLETYVIATHVNGLARDGIYHYRPYEHALERLTGSTTSRALSALLMGARPECVVHSAVTFVVSGVFVRMTYKYGDRGYRYVLMEAGAVCAQMCFSATALGLGSCQVAGFYDDAVEGLIGADGVNESVLSLVVVGEGGKQGGPEP